MRPITTESGQDRGLEIRFRCCRGQIDVCIAHRIDQGANQLGPADGRAAARSDVGCETIEKDDLPVEEDDGDLGPGFFMDRWPARTSFLW